jgi:hypothetical protein
MKSTASPEPAVTASLRRKGLLRREVLREGKVGTGVLGRCRKARTARTTGTARTQEKEVVLVVPAVLWALGVLLRVRVALFSRDFASTGHAGIRPTEPKGGSKMRTIVMLALMMLTGGYGVAQGQTPMEMREARRPSGYGLLPPFQGFEKQYSGFLGLTALRAFPETLSMSTLLSLSSAVPIRIHSLHRVDSDPPEGAT